MTAMQFEMLGADGIEVELAVQYVDHNVLQIDDRNMQDHKYLQTFCRRHGLRYSPAGNGISHYVHLERFAPTGRAARRRRLPHDAVGGGRHARGRRGRARRRGRAGRLRLRPGLPARRRGRADRARCLPGWRPRTSSSSCCVASRSVAAAGRSTSSPDPASPGCRSPQRATIANMITETGATTAVWPSDEQTRAWLRGPGPRGRLDAARRRPWCRVRRHRPHRPVVPRAAGRPATLALTTWCRSPRPPGPRSCRSASARRSTPATRTWRSSPRCCAAAASRTTCR